MRNAIRDLLSQGFERVKQHYTFTGKYWVHKYHSRLRVLVLSDHFCIVAPIPVDGRGNGHYIDKHSSSVIVPNTIPAVLEDRDNYVKYVLDGVEYEVIRSADNRLYRK